MFGKEIILNYILKRITTDFKDDNEPWINVNNKDYNDKRYRLGFNYEDNYVHDFKLSKSWDFLNFVQEYEDLKSTTEANYLVFKLYIDKKNKNSIMESINSHPKKINKGDILKIYPETISLHDKNYFNDDNVIRVLKYLYSRNITLKHIIKYNIQFVNSKICCFCHGENKDDCFCKSHNGINPYYNFIIIPSYENNKLSYFQGRNSVNSSFRYMNPKYPKKSVIFFYDLLKENDTIYVTEGVFDAMTLFDYSATSILSNKINEDQIRKILQKKPKKIVFVPDYDKKGVTKKIIFDNIHKSVKMIKKIRPIQYVGIYHWYKKDTDYKDINEANHTIIDDNLISEQM